MVAMQEQVRTEHEEVEASGAFARYRHKPVRIGSINGLWPEHTMGPVSVWQEWEVLQLVDIQS